MGILKIDLENKDEFLNYCTSKNCSYDDLINKLVNDTLKEEKPPVTPPKEENTQEKSELEKMLEGI